MSDKLKIDKEHFKQLKNMLLSVDPKDRQFALDILQTRDLDDSVSEELVNQLAEEYYKKEMPYFYNRVIKPNKLKGFYIPDE